MDFVSITNELHRHTIIKKKIKTDINGDPRSYEH